MLRSDDHCNVGLPVDMGLHIDGIYLDARCSISPLLRLVPWR